MTGPRPPELAPADWLRRIGEFAGDCALDGAGEEGERLREALVLLELAPSPHRGIIGALPSAAALEALIAAGGGAAAALALLGEWAGYMLSRAPGGAAMASVVVRASREASAEGATPALALLGAMARALAEARFRGDDQAGAAARLN